MAANLNLSPALRAGYLLLASMPEEKFSAVFAALDAPEPDPGLELYVQKIALAAQFQPRDARRILASTLVIFDFDSAKRRTFFEDVAAVLAAVPVEDVAAPPADAQVEPPIDGTRLVARLEALSRLTGVDFVNRARRILLQNERSVATMRIITDLRPVYGDGPPLAPAGMVIVHNLKIDFMLRAGMRTNETTFFALDDNDVISLIEILKRAAEKSIGLRKLAHEVRVPVLHPETLQLWNEEED